MDYYLKSGPVKKSRYTFGFLDENRDNDYHNQILDGIAEAARELDIDLIRFSYYSSHIAYKFSHQVDMVLDHIQQYDLDGLLFLGWTQAGAMYNKEDFLKRFSGLPMISLGTNFSNIPSVYFPGDLMIARMTRHLIEDHHYSKIAYIEHYRDDNRRDAYELVMAEYGLYDPMLYVGNDVLPQSDAKSRAKKALDVLLEERGINVQAIISLCYSDAFHILKGLEERGFRVPADIALVSYEEGDFAEYSLPGLTTIYFPWKELGYTGCKNLAKLLNEGSIPMETSVGENDSIIYRSSCGCLPYYLKPADDEHCRPAGHGPDAMSKEEKDDIVRKLSILHGGSGLCFEKLVDSFASSCVNRDSKIFLSDLDRQLRYTNANDKINELVTDIRNLLYPYMINDMDTLLWTGDLFLQAQVIVSETMACIHGTEVLKSRMIDRSLQTIKQQLLAKFSLQHLTDTLEKSMKQLHIGSCHRFISNSIFTGTDVEEDLFDNSMLIFRYRDGVRDKAFTAAGSLKRQLAEIQKKELGNLSLAYLLHVTDEIMGFALFGPDTWPMDEIIYQNLSTSISTALHGIVLLNRLDMTYKKLVEHSQREGMADIAANILHNIGNILNSINVSLHMMEKGTDSTVIDDIIMAGCLLHENMHRLEEFICSGGKGKKLMKLYLQLGSAASALQDHLSHNLKRLSDKVKTINEAVTAQQNYAGMDTKMEDLLIEPIIEDALKLNQDSLEKLQISVEKDYMPGFKSHVHRAKLFFVIFNIISNARDALANSAVTDKRITVSTYMDDTGKYIRISDNGKGIPASALDKVFEHGFSTKEGRYGYGLYSCAAYMTDMGGSIRAESDGENKGSSFIIKLA